MTSIGGKWTYAWRNYCQDRGFGVANKRKEELVALAYTAYTQNVPVVLSKDEEKLQVM